MKYFINKKITLVAVQEKYIEDILNWINNEDINRFLGSRFPVGMEQQIKWIRNIDNTKSKKLIIQNDKKENIGMVSLFKIDQKNQNAEIGIYIDPKFQNQGFSKLALKMVINFSFYGIKSS